MCSSILRLLHSLDTDDFYWSIWSTSLSRGEGDCSFYSSTLSLSLSLLLLLVSCLSFSLDTQVSQPPRRTRSRCFRLHLAFEETGRTETSKPMPRSFLITNRRYGDLTPPPVSTFDSPSLLASSGLSLLFPHQFAGHLTNQLVLRDEIQEEAEDLSMKKHKKVSSLSSSSSSTVSVVNESKELLVVPPSPFTKNSDAGSDGDSHLCPDCGKCYSTSSNLARHRQTHRSVTDQKARKCPHCEKVYVSSPAYSMHVRTHSQGCQVN